MAYCPVKKIAFSIVDGARRKDGEEEVSLPRYRGKVLYHCYATFIASNRETISDSSYIGSITY